MLHVRKREHTRSLSRAIAYRTFLRAISSLTTCPARLRPRFQDMGSDRAILDEFRLDRSTAPRKHSCPDESHSVDSDVDQLAHGKALAALEHAAVIVQLPKRHRDRGPIPPDDPHLRSLVGRPALRQKGVMLAHGAPPATTDVAEPCVERAGEPAVDQSRGEWPERRPRKALVQVSNGDRIFVERVDQGQRPASYGLPMKVVEPPRPRKPANEPKDHAHGQEQFHAKPQAKETTRHAEMGRGCAIMANKVLLNRPGLSSRRSPVPMYRNGCASLESET